MKKTYFLFLITSILLLTTSVYALPPTPPPTSEDMTHFNKSDKVFRESTEWTHIWIPDAKMNDKPYILLIGDSITMQYQSQVTKALKDKAYVGYITTSLSVADPLYPTLLTYILSLRKYNIIHFNNGLHGKPYTNEAYAAGYEKAIKLIKKNQPDAKIVLVSSTPIKLHADPSLQKTVIQRNTIVKKLAEKYALPLNDLYTEMKDKDTLHKDKFHYKKEGSNVLASNVTKTVLPILNTTKQP